MSSEGFLNKVHSLFSVKDALANDTLPHPYDKFDPKKFFFGSVCKKNPEHGRMRYISSGSCRCCGTERKRKTRDREREKANREIVKARRIDLAQKQSQDLSKQKENNLLFVKNDVVDFDCQTAQMTLPPEVETAKKEERSVTVYFMGYETNEGPIKIGHSVNEENRLERLQVAHPYTIAIITKFQGTRADEELLHEFFSHNRLRGEWFRRDDVILKVIHMVRKGIPFSEVIKHFNMKKQLCSQ